MANNQLLSTKIQNGNVVVFHALAILILVVVLGYIISLDPEWLHLRIDPMRPKHIIGAAIALIATLAILKWPEIGLISLVAIIYSNASENIARYHYMPSIIQFLVPLLLITIVVRTFISPKQKFVTDPMIVVLLIYGAIILLSSEIALNKSLADHDFFELAKNLVFFIIIINLMLSRDTLRHTVLALILVGALLAAISVYQVQTSSYGSEFSGFGRTDVAYVYGSYWTNRISGPVSDSNFYAQILIILVPVCLYRFWDATSLWLKALSACSLVFIVLAVIYTYSRGGAIALGVVLVLSLIHKKLRLRYLGFMLLAFLPFLVFMPTKFQSRLSTLEELLPGQDESKIHLDSSFQQRLLYMKTAWVMFSDNPFLGVGSGNYSEQYDKYSEQVGSIVSSYEHFGRPRLPHTLYLQVAAETGLVGFLIFMSIIFLTFWNFYSGYRQFKLAGDYDSASIVISLMFGLIGYLVSSIFLHGDYIRYFWLLVAIAVASRHIASNYKQSKISDCAFDSSNALVTKIK